MTQSDSYILDKDEVDYKSGAAGSPRFISVRISRRPSWKLSGQIVAEVKKNGVTVKTKRPGQAPPDTPRGPIKGFTKAAKKRLLEYMLTVDINSVAQPLKRSPQGKAFFVSLTYRQLYVSNYQRRKHLEAFKKRLVRQYGKTGVIWKLEYQERGTAHYHLMVFFPQLMDWRGFRDWCVGAWRSVTKDDCYPDVQTVYVEKNNVGKLINYIIKYLAKDFEADLPTGRVWGCWYPEMIPTSPDFVKHLTYEEYVEYLRRVRRINKDDRYLSSKIANYGGVTVFGLRSDTVQHLRGLGEYHMFDDD